MSASAADRNLLFGILALQMDFIHREALIQGLNELLYAELLVLRKTLGSDHEGRVLRSFRDFRLHEPEAGA